MKKVGGCFSLIFGGIILFWFLFINLPRVIEQLSAFNSSNSNGIAAITGTLIGNILILVVGIVLLRNGMKKLKKNKDNK